MVHPGGDDATQTEPCYLDTSQELGEGARFAFVLDFALRYIRQELGLVIQEERDAFAGECCVSG